KPEVLFLDEPTTGVDVVSRKEFWEMLAKLKSQGITIVVSTPYMDEATLCDRIALIDKGKIMSIDTPEAILKSFPKKLFAAKSDNIYRLLKALQEQGEVESCYAFGEYLHLTLSGDQDTSQLEDKIGRNSEFKNLELKTITPTIEDSFIRLMNEKNTQKIA